MTEYAASDRPPGIRICMHPTHSFNKGMDVLLLLFCTMLAWFLKEIRMSEGANRQGSPSTCMGIDLYVKSVTSRHWCSLSPWPPTWRAALGEKEVKREGERHLKTDISGNLKNTRCQQWVLVSITCVKRSHQGQWRQWMYFHSKIEKQGLNISQRKLVGNKQMK